MSRLALLPKLHAASDSKCPAIPLFRKLQLGTKGKEILTDGQKEVSLEVFSDGLQEVNPWNHATVREALK